MQISSLASMAVLYLKKFLLNIVYWHDDKAFLRRVTHHVLKVWNVLEYEFWLKVIPCLLMKSVIQRFRDKQYTNVHLHRNYNHMIYGINLWTDTAEFVIHIGELDIFVSVYKHVMRCQMSTVVDVTGVRSTWFHVHVYSISAKKAITNV